MTAMTAATIDRLSGGRMILGLGSSGPQVAEGWHGQRFSGQLQRTREYFEVVRMALRRERLEYHGETIELPLPNGPGRALKLTIAPVQDRIPIYLAAIGPRNTALAGEIADGWIPTFFAPEQIAPYRERLVEGATRGGRSLESFDVAPQVNVHISDDLEAARNLMRPGIALYVGGMGSREQNFYKTLVSQYGFGDAAQEIQDLYLAGRRDEACRAVPDELIDQVSLCGPAEVVAARLSVYRDAGVGTLIASPIAFSADDQIHSCGYWPSSPLDRLLRSAGRQRSRATADARTPPKGAADLPWRLRPARPRVSDARARGQIGRSADIGSPSKHGSGGASR